MRMTRAARTAAAAGLALTLAVLASASRALPTFAAVHGKAQVVLFVHGYDGSGSHDCAHDGDGWIHPLKAALQARGFQGKLQTIGYYTNDKNCDVMLQPINGYSDIGANGNPGEMTFKDFGAFFNNWIYTTYTSKNIPVDIVAHSEGGVISRAAVQWGTPGYTGAHSGFVTTYNIDVSDAVTIDSPHNGITPLFAPTCFSPECNALKGGSAELAWLHLVGNPQGWHGTQWTLFGSDADNLVDYPSATFMSVPAANMYQFHGYNHNQMTNNTQVFDQTALSLTYENDEITLTRPTWILYNTSLLPGQSLTSKNGRYVLTMDPSGDLIEYFMGVQIWHSGTASSNAYLAMQDDGNLVIYSSSSGAGANAGAPIWSTHTYGIGKSYLALEDDGNFGVFQGAFGPTRNLGGGDYYAFTGAAGGNSPIRGFGNKCLDVANGGTDFGTPVDISDCTNAVNQQWTISWYDGTIRSMGLCLETTAFNQQLFVDFCATPAPSIQTWTVTASGQFINNGTGLCADVDNFGTNNGTPVLAWTCKSPPENLQNQE
jgi:Ricin-type beta-trefoil lectin domain/Lipase (class 2)